MKFKVGDRVKIVCADEKEVRWNWTKSKSFCLGKEGRVVGLRPGCEAAYGVLFDEEEQILDKCDEFYGEDFCTRKTLRSNIWSARHLSLIRKRYDVE